MSDPLATSSVSSRFVSEDALKAAQTQREAEWKAAYERLGQEPPQLQRDDTDQPYDGRSLWEKLQENKVRDSLWPRRPHDLLDD